MQGEFEFGKVTARGASINDNIPEKEWHKITEETCQYFESTGKSHAQAAMILGDLLAFGDKHFHETYANVIDATREYMRLSINKLKRWEWVASRVEPSRRREVLSLEHHAEVAPLAAEKQDHYLQLAIDEAMTVKELRSMITESEPSKRKKKKKVAKEKEDESPEEIAKLMITASNWCSANFDSMTAKMKEPCKKFYQIYRRKWIGRKGRP